MKNFNLLFAVASTIVLASCGSKNEEAAIDAVVENYSLDVEASTLEWTGYKTGKEEGKHAGIIQFKGGTVETLNDVISSGTLTVDMTTIKTTDEMPTEYAEMLDGHLKNEDFFDVDNHPTVVVNLGEMKNGNLPTTIKVTGIDFTQDVPVSTKIENDKLIIDGEFSFDFEGIKSPGFQENDGKRISPKIDYKLHLELKK